MKSVENPFQAFRGMAFCLLAKSGKAVDRIKSYQYFPCYAGFPYPHGIKYVDNMENSVYIFIIYREFSIG